MRMEIRRIKDKSTKEILTEEEAELLEISAFVEGYFANNG